MRKNTFKTLISFNERRLIYQIKTLQENMTMKNVFFCLCLRSVLRDSRDKRLSQNFWYIKEVLKIMLQQFYSSMLKHIQICLSRNSPQMSGFSHRKQKFGYVHEFLNISYAALLAYLFTGNPEKSFSYLGAI